VCGVEQRGVLCGALPLVPGPLQLDVLDALRFGVDTTKSSFSERRWSEEGDTGSRVRVASVEGNDIDIEDSRRKGESMPVDTGDKERQRTAIGC
jgi:hypothetical protein